MWHRESGAAVPPWAATARQKGLSHVRRHAAKLRLADPDAELELDSVTEYDRGVTGAAMRQTHKGVPVYGGSLLVMLDAGGGPLELGRPADERVSRTGTSIDSLTPDEDRYVPGVYATIYADARRVETAPALSAAEAISAAKRELGSQGPFATPPEAELLILPHQLRNSGPEDAAGGASLVYRVELFVENAQESARWTYFIDARDGRSLWRFDAMQRGTGQSLYEGAVAFPSGYSNSTNWRFHCNDWRQNWGWYTWDASFQYGGMEAWDLNNQIPTGVMDFGAGCFWRGDFDDSRWGMAPLSGPGWTHYYAECDYTREPAGVEAMFGMMVAWDYFLTRHGWRGIDNRG